MTQKIEISTKTILFTIGLIIGMWFLYSISDILLLLFISFILMAALRPVVEYLEGHHIPRAVSIFAVYIIVMSAIAFTIVSIVPSLVTQMQRLIHALPKVAESVIPSISMNPSQVTQQLTPIGENIIKVIFGVFSNAFTVLTVFVLTFYMLLERQRLPETIERSIGPARATPLVELLSKIESRLGGWVQGEFLLMLCIGIATYIGLTILRVEYALPLAIIAGLLEIIPTIGPIISSLPAILIALSVSPLLALSVAALYFVIQQLENHILVPLVMNKSVGLPPLIIILALMVGGKIAGVSGAILSVPIVLLIEEMTRWYLSKES